MENKKVEYFDIYDIDRNKTGKIIKRGERMNEDEYHAFVQVWILNSKGKFLVQQRSKYVKDPLVWCSNGGNVISGEESYGCARREIIEELSLDTNDLEGGLFDSRVYKEDGQNYFCDSYLYVFDGKVSSIKFQKEEIKRLKYMKMKKIKALMAKKKFFIYDEDYLNFLEEEANKKKTKK